MLKVINQTIMYKGYLIETNILCNFYLNFRGLKQADLLNYSSEKSDLTYHVIW